MKKEELLQLQALLKIRQQRETKRRRELAQQREILNMRMQELDNARAAVMGFIAYRKAEEERHFQELAAEQQQSKALHYYRIALERLKEQQLILEDNITSCNQVVADAFVAVNQAQQAHQSAAKEVEKFTELEEKSANKWNVALRKKEEAEIEEISLAAWADARRD